MRSTTRGILGIVMVVGSSACSNGPPAPYVPPPPGTVYFYSGGLASRIVSNDGIRTRFADRNGRPGSRLGLFIPELPNRPAVVDPAKLAALWPLEVGNVDTVDIQQGEQSERWQFIVDAYERITVPKGEYMAHRVQGRQSVRRPTDTAYVPLAEHIWFYSADLNAVVDFGSRYVQGPLAGRQFGAQLVEIAPAGDTAAMRRGFAKQAERARADSVRGAAAAGVSPVPVGPPGVMGADSIRRRP